MLHLKDIFLSFKMFQTRRRYLFSIKSCDKNTLRYKLNLVAVYIFSFTEYERTCLEILKNPTLGKKVKIPLKINIWQLKSF